jgi:hypothetical protein
VSNKEPPRTPEIFLELKHLLNTDGGVRLKLIIKNPEAKNLTTLTL